MVHHPQTALGGSQTVVHFSLRDHVAVAAAVSNASSFWYRKCFGVNCEQPTPCFDVDHFLAPTTLVKRRKCRLKQASSKTPRLPPLHISKIWMPISIGS